MMTSPLRRIWDELRPSGLRFHSVGAIGEFEVRAEIPGVDPTQDIRIWLSDGVLRVEVTRAPTRADQIRSEFHYGRSIGAVGVPPQVDERQLSATYDRGVLTIANAPAAAQGRPIPIRVGQIGDVTVA
jgi:HSP20 family protein